jgi:GNAT superfamily N-acetyltransferase
VTVTVVTLSAAGDSAERERFLARFTSSAAGLRTGDYAASVPSAAYTKAVLALALQRLSELFLVVDGDRVLARALVSKSFAREGGTALGLFEVAPDSVDSAGALVIEAASMWAVANALPDIFAPLDVNTWLSYRFLIQPDATLAGPERYSWEPAQPREHLELFSRHGFEEAERYRTIGLQHKGDVGLADAVRHTAPARAAAEAAGYRFQRLDTADEIGVLMEEIHRLSMGAFRDNYLFEPIPLEMFRAMYAGAAASRDCSLSHIVRDAAGAIAGFVFVFIDRGDVIIKTIAVGPEARGKHVSTALIHLVLARAAERGYKTIVSALVRCGNTSEFLSQRHMHDDVATWRRDYVLLRKRVGE